MSGKYSLDISSCVENNQIHHTNNSYFEWRNSWKRELGNIIKILDDDIGFNPDNKDYEVRRFIRFMFDTTDTKYSSVRQEHRKIMPWDEYNSNSYIRCETGSSAYELCEYVARENLPFFSSNYDHISIYKYMPREFVLSFLNND